MHQGNQSLDLALIVKPYITMLARSVTVIVFVYSLSLPFLFCFRDPENFCLPLFQVRHVSEDMRRFAVFLLFLLLLVQFGFEFHDNSLGDRFEGFRVVARWFSHLKLRPQEGVLQRLSCCPSLQNNLKRAGPRLSLQKNKNKERTKEN